MDDKAADKLRKVYVAKDLMNGGYRYEKSRGMFADACNIWRFVGVGPPHDADNSASTVWFICREGVAKLHPSLDFSTYPKVDFSFNLKPKDIKISRLQTVVHRLDDSDMLVFFRNLVIRNERNAKEFFTEEFVGEDERLKFIAAYVAEHGDPGFNGSEMVDDDIRFIGGKACRMSRV